MRYLARGRKPVAVCTGRAVFHERQEAGSDYAQDVRYFAGGMDAGSKDARELLVMSFSFKIADDVQGNTVAGECSVNHYTVAPTR